MKYDLAIVGHIVLDYIQSGRKIRGPFLGGSGVYAGLAARKLEGSVLAVGTVGKDFGRKRLNWLQRNGIDIHNVNVAPCETTRFLITNLNGSRRMAMISKCDPVNVHDLSQIESCHAVHLGPINGEISEDLAIRIARKSAITSLDPQGYLRHVTFTGKIEAASWFHSGLLKAIDVLKLAEYELKHLFGARCSPKSFTKLGPDVILVTKGEKGTLVWSRSEGLNHLPSYRTTVRDPTGAGDALGGAFLVTLMRTGELLWSASVGSAVASFVVEQYGPASFGSSKRIETRAKDIFERIRRVR